MHTRIFADTFAAVAWVWQVQKVSEYLHKRGRNFHTTRSGNLTQMSNEGEAN
jgi:hypothetical protein